MKNSRFFCLLVTDKCRIKLNKRKNKQFYLVKKLKRRKLFCFAKNKKKIWTRHLSALCCYDSAYDSCKCVYDGFHSNVSTEHKRNRNKFGLMFHEYLSWKCTQNAAPCGNSIEFCSVFMYSFHIAHRSSHITHRQASVIHGKCR